MFLKYAPRLPVKPVFNAPHVLTLTALEEKITRLVSEGQKNAAIAVTLFTTEHMVKNYLCEIYDKTGMSNRVELALWYVARHPGDEITTVSNELLGLPYNDREQ